MVVHLSRRTAVTTQLYLRNYAVLQRQATCWRGSPGVGDVQLFGGGDYAMRIWLDPEEARRAQSDRRRCRRRRSASRTCKWPPASSAHRPCRARRFSARAQRQGAPDDDGASSATSSSRPAPTVRSCACGDVARVELGAADYALRALLEQQARRRAFRSSRRPGANALQLSAEVRATMEELKKDFPQGIDYTIVYDPTCSCASRSKRWCTRCSRRSLLVVLVVIVFLQTWRASVIPLVAVPVSLIGTFAVLLAFGFSINTLSLFGLVLAIGIVVDDAIVVVENVERTSKRTVPVRGHQVRDERGDRPIIAITLVLCAVFVPIAFISGLTGQFYRQFALTIAISTVISAFNSLTLSPALAAAAAQAATAPSRTCCRASWTACSAGSSGPSTAGSRASVMRYPAASSAPSAVSASRSSSMAG